MPADEIISVVKLKYQSNTTMLPIGIKYVMRDLVCDVNA